MMVLMLDWVVLVFFAPVAAGVVIAAGIAAWIVIAEWWTESSS